MSTNAQIAANQKNAQLSTGPVTVPGLEKSSRNSTVHGFTGQTLIITPQEKEAYDAHVAAYMAAHNVTEHKHRQLVQQLADSHWSLHQIFVQQTNTMALMTGVHLQMSEAGSDAIATAAAIAPVARTLNTLSTYESRRRRAAKTIQEELNALEQEISERRPAPNFPSNSTETKDEPEIGSVCSSPAQAATQNDYDTWLRETEALLAQLEAEVGPEEAAAIRREAAKMSR
jgi:chromosome segregation ATPase